MKYSIDRFALVSVLVFVSLLSGCSSESETPAIACDGNTISFSTEVLPIIQNSCATNSGCHATGSSRGPGALTNFSEVFNARASVKTSVSNGSMPQGSTLSSDQKAKIVCWIENGAPNN